MVRWGGRETKKTRESGKALRGRSRKKEGKENQGGEIE